MSNDYSPRSAGGSSRGRRRGGRRSENNPDRSSSHRSEKKPGTLIGKIQSFFSKTFGGKAASKPTSSYSNGHSSRPRPTSSASAPKKPSGPKSVLEEPRPELVTGPRLYAGNLSYDTSESDLFDLFSTVGAVKNVELVMDRRANRSKGFGFVEMSDIDIAKQAVMKLHRKDFMGRQIVVSGAKSERKETEDQQAV